MVTAGKSSSFTGFEIVFRLVMVRSSYRSMMMMMMMMMMMNNNVLTIPKTKTTCQLVKIFLAKLAEPARARITRMNQMSRVRKDLLSKY